MRAVHDQALPHGWTAPVSEVAAVPGQAYRYEWELADRSQRFRFNGLLLASAPQRRTVTTEQMIGMDCDPTINEMKLNPVTGRSLLKIFTTSPSAEVRDTVLGPGMTHGIQTSYARPDAVLAAA